MKPDDFASVADLCQALVRIPSENPAGAPHSAGERQLAEFVGEYLRALGADVSFEPAVGGDRPNVYGAFPSPRQARSRLLFAPHLDTVPVTGMTVDPFGGEARDGRIYGRGATDTKGTMAAMLWALRDLDWQALPVSVAFAGLADEEDEQRGAKVCAERAMADFVVVGEPTELQTVHTHKGTCWLRLEASGRAAHASAPDRGENAIEKLTRAFSELKRHFPDLAAVGPHATLGEATISLGTIQGGSKINVVPDRCWAEVDIRTLPGQENMAEAVRRFFDERQTGVSVRPLKVSQPLFTAPDEPHVARLAALGSSPVGAPWFCDAAVFAAAGTPAVALGPGSIRQAHTADEHVTVADLEAGAQFYRRFLEAFRHA